MALVMFALLILATPRLRAQSTRNDQRESPEVRRLVLHGVDHVDRRDLAKSLSTQASQCKSLLLEVFCLFSKSPTFMDKHYLDRTELARDLLRIRVYYWKRGYREASADSAVARNGTGVTVTFNVTEGPPTLITAIRVDYDSTLVSERTRKRLTTLHAGEPLDLLALDTMRLNFQNEMWQRGYSDAVVDTAIAVHDSTHTAAVAMRVVPNWPTSVGNVVVSGNQRVSTQTILDIISLRPGQPFRRQDMLQSQRSLYESSLFRLAAILPPTGDSIKTLQIQVIEAPLHEARAGGGFDNIQFGQLQAAYTSYNLLGGARRLDITGTAGNLLAPSLNGRWPFADVPNLFAVENDRAFLQPTWTGSIDFKQPSFLRRPADQFGLGIFAHRRMEPGIYIDRGYGAQATLTHKFSDNAPASLNYRYEVTRVDAGDVYFCVNYGICDTTTISAVRSHGILSPLTLTSFVDRSDRPFNPTQGYVAHLSLEHASRYTASDYRYNRASGDVAAYWHPSNSSNVFAGHLRLGIVRPMRSSRGDTVLHPRSRFYAGGAMSVRGYGENQLGPRVLTIAPELLRHQQVDQNGDTTYTCAPSIPITQCDPNAAGLPDKNFDPRPVGGTSVVEASVEWRFPLILQLDGAVFVDGAIVGNSKLSSFSDIGSIASLANTTSAITPGFGIRYNSPVGPVRVDVGIRPLISEDLSVITADSTSGDRRLVTLATKRTYTSGGKTLLSRLMLHFSIGQAY
ncbi:MAG TPA: BamA/TamA family outer membrane protein [Gemmatimonadaceae bacterium]|nr:BamA/TamA family outer membrane protein [Gemmatimonadaceae bacterium]